MAKGPRGLVEKREAAEKRKLYSRVLIVCEGMKTEPLYLSDLRDELKAPTINCEVVGEGRDPSAVVKRAVEHAESPDGDYDYVFCVFDRDKHEHYADACERCRNVEVKRRGGNRDKTGRYHDKSIFRILAASPPRPDDEALSSSGE